MTSQFDNIFSDDNIFEDSPAAKKTIHLKDGERRNVSILFADIHGFTKLSEKLDHEVVQSLIDKLMSLFTNSVEKFGGYVANININLKESSKVKLYIYDIAGKRVDVLVDGLLEEGYHKVVWNANQYSSGIYFVKMIIGDYIDTQKLMLVK